VTGAARALAARLGPRHPEGVGLDDFKQIFDRNDAIELGFRVVA
jgi:hypothetical protein